MSSRKRLFLPFSPFLRSSWRVSSREALSCLTSSKRNPMNSSNGFESFDLMLSIDVVTVTTVPVSIGVCGETTNSPRCSESLQHRILQKRRRGVMASRENDTLVCRETGMNCDYVPVLFDLCLPLLAWRVVFLRPTHSIMQNGCYYQ